MKNHDNRARRQSRRRTAPPEPPQGGVASSTLADSMSEVGREAWAGLRACAERLQSDTEASADATVRIEVGLTSAARTVILAYRSLDAHDLATLVAHARASGLIQKRSTPIPFALMRVACGRALSASIVSRATRLIQHVIDTEEDVETALPERGMFWRQYEMYCGKGATAQARVDSRVTLVLPIGMLDQLRTASSVILEVSWDARSRRAIGCAAMTARPEVERGRDDAGWDATHLPLHAPPRLITYQPAATHGAPSPQFDRAIAAEDALASTSSGVGEDEAAIARFEPAPGGVYAGTSSNRPVEAEPSGVEVAPMREPTTHEREGRSTPMTDQVLLKAVAYADGDLAHVVFQVNVKVQSPSDFALLRRGRWVKAPVGGVERSVWHGPLSEHVREVMARHGGRIVMPDTGLRG